MKKEDLEVTVVMCFPRSYHGTNQPQLEWDTRAKRRKNACHTHANAKIKFCVCLRVLIESVAEWIYSCWIIVSRQFIVLNRTL